MAGDSEDPAFAAAAAAAAGDQERGRDRDSHQRQVDDIRDWIPSQVEPVVLAARNIVNGGAGLCANGRLRAYGTFGGSQL